MACLFIPFASSDDDVEHPLPIVDDLQKLKTNIDDQDDGDDDHE